MTGPDGLPAVTIDVNVMHLDASGDWTSVAFDSTDNQGHFDLWAPPGIERLAFHPYLDTSVYLPTYYPNAETIEAADDIEVAAGSIHDVAVELRTGPHAELNGTVVGTDGSPVAGAQVQFWTNRGTVEEPWWVNQYLVSTDESGHYRELIKPGTYRISYRRALYVEAFHGGSHAVETAPDVTVGGGETLQLDATMTQATLIRGNVLAYGTNNPIPGTRVDFYRNDGTPDAPHWSLAGSATPNWNTGAYAKQLAPGDYLVRAVDPYSAYLSEYFDKAVAASSARVVTLALESTVADVTIRMTRARATPLGAVASPVVSGSPVLGETLTASAGTWSATPATVIFQWNSDGIPIAGATAATYHLGAADVGHTMSVRVGAYAPGLAPAAQTSASTAVVTEEATVVVTAPKVASSTTVRASKHGKHTTLTVTVTAPTDVTGRVRLLRAGHVLRTSTLYAGKASFTIRHQTHGTQRYKITYLGSATLLSSQAFIRVPAGNSARTRSQARSTR